MSAEYCVILATAGGREEADRIAEALVSRRLAACVQLTEIASTYRWEGEVTKGAEWLMLIKTTAARYEAVEAAILELHTYDVPEIVQLPIVRGSAAYLAWVGEATA
jgi:periplasmic divalent cation tolerance protein